MAEYKVLNNAQDEANSVVWRTEYINKQALAGDVVAKRDYDILKLLITHKEEEAYNKGYADAASEIFDEIYEDCFDQYGYIDYEALAELKKKYTEGEG